MRKKKNQNFVLILHSALLVKILKIQKKQLREMVTFCHGFDGCWDCCFLLCPWNDWLSIGYSIVLWFKVFFIQSGYISLSEICNSSLMALLTVSLITQHILWTLFSFKKYVLLIYSEGGSGLGRAGGYRDKSPHQWSWRFQAEPASNK